MKNVQFACLLTTPISGIHGNWVIEHTSRVLSAGVQGILRKSGDVCPAIFGRPGMISRCKNAH